MNSKDNKKTVKFIVDGCRKYSGGIFICCLCSLFSSVGLISLALFSRTVIDIAVGDRNGNFTFYCVMLFVIIVGIIVVNIINAGLKVRIEGKLDISFKRQLFSAITEKSYSSVKNYHSGELINRMSSDIQTVVKGVTGIIPSVVSLVSKLVLGLIALATISGKLTLIIMAVGIIVPVMGRLISRKYKFLHKEYQRTMGVVKSFLQECFENIAVIKTFPSIKPTEKKLNGALYDNYGFLIRRNRFNIFASSGLYFVFTVGYYALLVWGALNIGNNVFTYGTLIAFLQIVSQLRAPLQNISGILPQYYSMTASAERLMEIVSLEREVKSEKTVSAQDFKYIEADNISFTYGDGDVITDSSFRIERGSITAVVGSSGSGKSTLFKILLGLLNCKRGTIKINGDICIDASCRHLFSYVPQGSMILSGTILENLTVCRENITMDEVVNAVKTADIYDYIMSLPKGFDTLLSEHGMGMSEGQLQRIAIARAVLCDSPVLLLDECTSALDEKTEETVLANIKSLSDKTVVLITHRKKCLEICDNILEFDNKKIIQK